MKAYRNIDDDLVEISLEVPLGDQGMRLDKFIQRHISRLSRTRVQDIIARGVVDGQGKATKPSRIVQVGEVFRWRRQVEVEQARVILMPIVHDDARFLAVNKPGDLVVHPTAKVWRNTVTHWLNEHRPGAKIAHRLDRETSGVLMCGYGEWSAWLKELFRKGEAKKTYLAIVRGTPSFDELRCDLAMSLDPDSPLKVKMRVDPGGLPSVTELRVLERVGGHALVECKPETGRQHQIRVHLWALGHPLLGDKLYGVSDAIFKESADHGSTERVVAATGAERHMLHAAALAFRSPEGEPLRFEAELHDDMQATLDRLRAMGADPRPPAGSPEGLPHC